jgi:hypothetical protein
MANHKSRESGDAHLNVEHIAARRNAVDPAFMLNNNLSKVHGRLILREMAGG